ncbi:hypothetical protein Cgig2_033111 [Carnegiea gigantea]|uniref:DUF4283 domain-containing protein n=1 Tax=Carnegiea gigantea TaxID=171969 RepID=A0A9Q1QBB8_9CARY|nr:hypothetical protein Cgig2_033111 [Carnegiea gigantea]
MTEIEPNVQEMVIPNTGILGVERGTSYRDTLQCNNPNLHFETRENPIWEDDGRDNVSEDDEPPEEEDPMCPMILLTAAKKRILQVPWRNALIIKMFDKGIGFLQLKRRLKTKWVLKGDFSLIDIGRDYYVTRFSNLEDYDHVMTNGPWMIGDNYLVIREWVPNLVLEENSITRPTAWVKIPKLSVEYFNKDSLLHKIGSKIGKAAGREATEPNLNRQTRANEPTRNGLNPRVELHKVSGGHEEILAQLRSVNRGGNKESDAIQTQDQGSRFRALATIDLNVDMETAMDVEQDFGDKSIMNLELMILFCKEKLMRNFYWIIT